MGTDWGGDANKNDLSEPAVSARKQHRAFNEVI